MIAVKQAMYSSWGSVEMTCTPLAPLICIIYRGARTPSIHNEFKLDEPPHTPFNTIYLHVQYND
jgi:hypothetical protein